MLNLLILCTDLILKLLIFLQNSIIFKYFRDFDILYLISLVVLVLLILKNINKFIINI